MSQKKLDKMMEEMNARLDEMEHRTQVEKKACELIAQGKDDEAIALINTLDDSVFDKRIDYSNFEQAQEAIYKELPAVVEKVFHAAFMNCTRGFTISDESDWRFIKPFIDEMDRVYKLTARGQITQLKAVWGNSEDLCKAGGTKRMK